MKKNTVNLISLAGNLFSLKALMHATGKANICLFYHSVNDTAPAHLKQLYRPRTSKEFISDLDYLSRHFDFISTAEISGKGGSTEKPTLHLSFDDGLKACYELIYPLLMQKGIPATFFVNPSFVDNHNMFHCHKASLLKAAFLEHRVALQNENGEAIAESSFLKHITGIKGFSNNHYQQLAEQLGVNFETYLRAHQPYLNLEQIKKMKSDGFEFGGHTLTHPLLKGLPEADQLAEISGSMQWLKENNIGNDGYFAFPFNDTGISQQLFFKMKALGITQSFGTSGMKADVFDTHHHRICFENSGKQAARLLKQQLFKYRVLKLMGKNKIARH